MTPTPPIRIGALISGTGSNLGAILKAYETGQINGRVAFVGTDNPGAKGLEKAENRGIPTFVVDYSKIIRDFKQDPDPMRLPDDYDGGAIISRQSLFPKGTEPQKIATY